MAYNPFNIFRRNQKAIFAVLVVFIMIMFTLSSGVAGGDFFDWFPRWLGSKSKKGDHVVTIDGEKVYEDELTGPKGLRFKRVMANRFMQLAAQRTESAIEDYLVQQQGRLGPEGQAAVQGALQTVTFLGNPRFGAIIVQQLPILIDSLNEQLKSPSAREEDKSAIRAVQLLYRLLYQRYQVAFQGGGEHYFANAPNKNNRDLLEFMLWEKKADQLGITFGDDEVKALIQAELGNFHKDDAPIRAQLAKGMHGYTEETLMRALAAEFRVRAAQKAVLGHTGRGSPVFMTPSELFDFYREQASPAVYEVVSVPSAAFVERVTAEPSEAELRELYTRHQHDEPKPNSPTPGFKQPRKVAVGFVAATGEEPYYKKLAEEHFRLGEAMAKASGMLTVPIPGAGGAWFAAAGAPLSVREPLVHAAYEVLTVMRHEAEVRNQYSSAIMFPRDVLDTSVVRPGTMAAAVGAMGGQLGFGTPAGAAPLIYGAAVGYEVRDRVKTGVPLVLGAMPGPAMLPTAVGGAVAYKASEPKPLPIEAVRPVLMKDLVARKTRQLMIQDLVKFAEDVRKLSGNHRPRGAEDFIGTAALAVTARAAADKQIDELGARGREDAERVRVVVENYIRDFVASRGIQMGGSAPSPGAPPGSPPVLRDEWTLEEDPGLQALVQAQKEGLKRASGFHGAGNDFVPFGRSFFWNDIPTEMGTMRRVPTSGLYQPQFYPEQRPTEDPFHTGPAKPQYMVWRTADQPAAATNFITAREAVKTAWKRLKAREQARAKADELANMIRGGSTSPDLITYQLRDEVERLKAQAADPKAAAKVKQFTLSGVAPLAPAEFDPSNPSARFGAVQPYRLAPSENIPYPTPEMEKTLLENRDKPPRTVVVMPDAGQDTFYVATLVRRNVKTPEEFKHNVYSPTGAARRAVMEEFRFANARKSLESVRELLKKEFKYEETEEQKKKLDENAKSGNRGD